VRCTATTTKGTEIFDQDDDEIDDEDDRVENNADDDDDEGVEDNEDDEDDEDDVDYEDGGYLRGTDEGPRGAQDVADMGPRVGRICV